MTDNGYHVPLPASARPVGALGIAAAVARAAVRESGTALRRRRRTPQRSAAEYEARWHRQRESGRWRAHATPASATRASSYGDARLRALLDFTAYDVPAPDFFDWRARKLAAIVSAHVPRHAPVLELGCGLGKNLIALAAHGFTDLTGADVSPSAVAAVREQFDHFGIAGSAEVADVLDGPAVDRLVRGRAVLTNYVIEQLPRHVARVVDTIAAAGPRMVLHIEPCHERLPGRRAWERLPSVWHARANDYQSTLLTCLRRLDRARRVRLLEITPLGMSPYLFHGGVLIRWEPAGER